MERFDVYKPSDCLRPYVLEYWFVCLENTAFIEQRILPTGYSLLTFYRQKGTWYNSRAMQQVSGYSGQQSTFSIAGFSGTTDFIAVVFTALGANAVFQRPMTDFENAVCCFDLMDDPLLNELQSRLQTDFNDYTCVQMIERYLLRRISEQKNTLTLQRIASSIALVNNGVYSVQHLAADACLSYKQYQRLFRECVGLNPKDFIRIVRFQKTMALLQNKRRYSLDDLSDYCGYTDKSHLIKDVSSLSGCSPSALLSSVETYSSYHALFRSFFIDVK